MAVLLRQTKKPIVVGDELVFQVRRAPTLVVVRSEDVTQGEAEMKYVSSSGLGWGTRVG